MEIIINIKDLPDNSLFHYKYIALLSVRIVDGIIYGRLLDNPKREIKINEFMIKTSNMFTSLGIPICLLHYYDKSLCNIHNIDMMKDERINIYTYKYDIFNNIKCDSFYRCQ